MDDGNEEEEDDDDDDDNEDGVDVELSHTFCKLSPLAPSSVT